MCMDAFGCVWMNMDAYECVWMSMDVYYGCVLLMRMDVYGYVDIL